MIWELLDRPTVGYVQYMRLNNLLPNLAEIDILYTNRPPDSKLRPFIVPSGAYIIPDGSECLRRWCLGKCKVPALFNKHPDFLFNAIDLQRNQAGKSLADPREAPTCRYHNHASKNVCPWSVWYEDDGMREA